VTAREAFQLWSRKIWIVGGISLAGLLLLVGLVVMALAGSDRRHRPE
jgi:hypothetical protein